MKILNVGGGSKDIPIPQFYEGWQHILLDIDPRGGTDIVCDALKLTTLPPQEYDSVYCSHNLEHYYKHDVAKVLSGFIHILKPDGFAFIRVPDIYEVMKQALAKNLDIEDNLYMSPSGPITVRDVLYGYSVEIERTNQPYYAHKTGFTIKSLSAALAKAGFRHAFTRPGPWEIGMFAFTNKPSAEFTKLLGIPQI